jgi:hypothetical protein
MVSRTPQKRTFFEDLFGLFRKNSVCFSCFDWTETPKQTEETVFWFRETNRKQPKQIEFRFVSVRTKKKFDCFEDTLVMGDIPIKRSTNHDPTI